MKFKDPIFFIFNKYTFLVSYCVNAISAFPNNYFLKFFYLVLMSNLLEQNGHPKMLGLSQSLITLVTLNCSSPIFLISEKFSRLRVIMSKKQKTGKTLCNTQVTHFYWIHLRHTCHGKVPLVVKGC